MKVYKTKKGYYYKEYKNCKKKRIGKDEYLKHKSKKISIIKKGGNSNKPIPTLVNISKRKEIIIYNNIKKIDVFTFESMHTRPYKEYIMYHLPCWLLPDSITGGLQEYQKYQKFLKNELNQGDYNNNIRNKLLSQFNFSPKYPKRFADILNETNIRKNKNISLKTKWWYKVIKKKNTFKKKFNNKKKHGNNSSGIFFEGVINNNNNNTKFYDQKDLQITDINYEVLTKSNSHYGGGAESESSNISVPPVPPGPNNQTKWTYNFTDYTDLDGVYISYSIRRSNKYKNEIIINKVKKSASSAGRFTLESYIDYLKEYESDSIEIKHLTDILNTNNDTLINEEAVKYIFDKYLKYMNCENYLHIIKIENNKIIKLNTYTIPYLFFSASKYFNGYNILSPLLNNTFINNFHYASNLFFNLMGYPEEINSYLNERDLSYIPFLYTNLPNNNNNNNNNNPRL